MQKKKSKPIREKVQKILIGNSVGVYREACLKRGYTIDGADIMLKNTIAQLLSLIKDTVEELIGEYEQYAKEKPVGEDYLWGRNKLKAEQRKKLKKML